MSDRSVTRIYARHHQKYYDEHETVDDALNAQYWGAELGAIHPMQVLDADGDVVFDQHEHENIFDFCEEREYDWIAEYAK
jgi:hypothetical protein